MERWIRGVPLGRSPHVSLALKTEPGGSAPPACIPLRQLAWGEGPMGRWMPVRLCRAGEPGRTCTPEDPREANEGVGTRSEGGGRRRRGVVWYIACRGWEA